METIVDRLQKALSAKKLSWSKASTMIGLSPQAPSKWKKGQISKDTLEKLAGILEVDIGWLMTGGEPISAQVEKAKPVITQEYGNVKPTGKILREIPVLDFVQAGLWREVAYDGLHPKGKTYTSYEGVDPRAVFSLTIDGMSMAPEFLPGDEIVVDAAKAPVPGSLVVAQEIQHGSALTTFKKYRVIGINEHGVDVIELVPLNPDFPTYNSTQIEISIIGVVVQHHREFKY
ncbi:helix-turn-helix domain-containing protein [Acinetobacter sp. RF14B]|uniref:helix-turn-helix domain-containing protein n=1 Tax=Acinetobacter sp. RF14B TaxID=2650965 RepID=UPI00116C0D20|nr:S24 family peptidase [Acinetobacter sp. RF14B]TQR66836.1 LexA family transcriptional repressor [Acinetobacter sp. RF14B]